MNKLALSDQDNDKKVIAFTINKAIKQQLADVLKKSKDYNLKEKSRWINEAIVMFKESKDCDFKEIAAQAEGSGKAFVFDRVHMNFKQRCFFAEMKHDFIRAAPYVRGPQSAILRAAILNRLMREE